MRINGTLYEKLFLFTLGVVDCSLAQQAKVKICGIKQEADGG